MYGYVDVDKIIASSDSQNDNSNYRYNNFSSGDGTDRRQGYATDSSSLSDPAHPPTLPVVCPSVCSRWTAAERHRDRFRWPYLEVGVKEIRVHLAL